MGVPRPILATAFCVACSVFGDGGLYVVLPVIFKERGLSAIQVGAILSINRWTRLLTNGLAANLLGTMPVRRVFAGALLVGGLCSWVYAATTSVALLLLARCVWGGCWSLIRLTSLLTVTDCVDAGLASEKQVGKMTGISAGTSRIGLALAMAACGWLCDRVGFSSLFFGLGILTMLASPYAAFVAFGRQLPEVSTTAANRLAQLDPEGHGSACGLPRLDLAQWQLAQWQLFALAFGTSCAGNGMIVATLGAVLASNASTDDVTGRSVLEFGARLRVETATLTGLLLGLRWFVESSGAPMIGWMVDRWGWRRVAPASFALSATNGAIGFALLRWAELGGARSLLLLVLLSLMAFFLLVSIADLCVKSMGVAWRESVLLVQGNDFGAAVGPLLGYALFHLRLPSSALFAAQSLVHGTSAVIALLLAQATTEGTGADAGKECDGAPAAPGTNGAHPEAGPEPEEIGACTEMTKLKATSNGTSNHTSNGAA